MFYHLVWRLSSRRQHSLENTHISILFVVSSYFVPSTSFVLAPGGPLWHMQAYCRCTTPNSSRLHVCHQHCAFVPSVSQCNPEGWVLSPRASALALDLAPFHWTRTVWHSNVGIFYHCLAMPLYPLPRMHTIGTGVGVDSSNFVSINSNWSTTSSSAGSSAPYLHPTTIPFQLGMHLYWCYSWDALLSWCLPSTHRPHGHLLLERILPLLGMYPMSTFFLGMYSISSFLTMMSPCPTPPRGCIMRPACSQVCTLH